VKPNAPIPGHHLLHEGAIYKSRDPDVGPWSTDEERYVGGCACGAKPTDFPDISIRAMKRWHRQHRAELRGQHTAPTEEGILVYVNDAGGGRVHAYIGRDEENYPEEGWYRLVPAQVEPHEIKGPNVIVDNLERCKAWHPALRWVSCEKEKGHEGYHEAHHGYRDLVMETWS